MSTKIVFKYIPERNPREAYFLGVPLDDLTEKKFESLSESQQKSVLNAPFYEPVADVEATAVLDEWSNDEEE